MDCRAGTAACSSYKSAFAVNGSITPCEPGYEVGVLPLALLRLVSDAAVLAISALKDSREGKIPVKRRPVQAKRRDLDAAKINLFRPIQTRVAFRWKTHLMATREPDEDQAARRLRRMTGARRSPAMSSMKAVR